MIEQSFQYNIVVLGDKSVGKSTFVSKVTNKDPNQNLQDTFTGDITNLYQGSQPEIIKFNLPLSPAEESKSNLTSLNESQSLRESVQLSETIEVVFWDTRSTQGSLALNQYYRDMQAFIVMCDVQNLSSIRNVPLWLDAIYERSNVLNGRQILVLVNKIETLQDEEESASESAGDRTSDQSPNSPLTQNSTSKPKIRRASQINQQKHISVFQNNELNKMYQLLARKYQDVFVEEISATLQINTKETMFGLADELKRNQKNYIQQKYRQMLERQGSSIMDNQNRPDVDEFLNNPNQLGVRRDTVNLHQSNQSLRG